MNFKLAIAAFCVTSVAGFTTPTGVSTKTALFADNSNPFGGKSLEYTGGDDPNNKNYGRLSEKLDEADIERKKASEAARAFERQAEIKREERRRKIKFMNDMPDDTPAGKGK